MELTWIMRIRIALAALAGIGLLGMLAWGVVAPPNPMTAVLAKDVSIIETFILLVLCFSLGLISYFLCWPYGRQIGVLAVPAGLGLWAVRSENIASLIQINPDFQSRVELFNAVMWGPSTWLALVAAGLVGVAVGNFILTPQRDQLTREETEDKPKSPASHLIVSIDYLNWALALVGSALIIHFMLAITNQGVTIQDGKLGLVLGQPATAQIAMACFVSFGLAAFIVKATLNAGYLWPMLAALPVSLFSMNVYLKPDAVKYMADNLPAVFFPHAATSVLPVQMVAFGSIGAIAGYWLAVHYDFWKNSES